MVSDQILVDIDLTEIINKNGNPKTVIIRQQPVDQGGLTGPEITANDGDRNAFKWQLIGRCHYRGAGWPSKTVPQIGMSRSASGITIKPLIALNGWSISASVRSAAVDLV